MYNNPFYFPYAQLSKPSLFASLKNLNFGNILNGTQKTLSVINQAIPIFYQIKPLWNNTKTIFRIAEEVNKDEPVLNTNNNKNNNINNNNIKKEEVKSIKYNEPTFFL